MYVVLFENEEIRAAKYVIILELLICCGGQFMLINFNIGTLRIQSAQPLLNMTSDLF